MSDGGFSVGAEVFAEFGKAVKLLLNNQQEIERQRFERRQRQENRNPLDHWTYGNIIGVSGTVDLGGPERGRRWIVKRLNAVDAVGPGTATAGAFIDFYVSATAPTTNNDAFGWSWRLSGVPVQDRFSDDQIVVREREHLWAVLSTGTTAHNYVISAFIQDHDVAGKAGLEYPV